jgi:hypothetical protein
MCQPTLNLETRNPKPETVECLGQRFPSEEARREHYLELLARKLKDPEFRKIEGFPIGKDEDILALSDPPYYTACPNPWLEEFIKCYGKPYDPKQPYHCEPFAADVSEGKTHPIYSAHSYHTKVPHRALMRYILHYTQPGDFVFDGFCGTGMTGVAAQLCADRDEVQQLGYRVRDDGTLLDDEGKPFSKLGVRRVILNDLSPAATFIAYSHNIPVDAHAFEKEAEQILKEVGDEFGWLYETIHTDGKAKGRINYTVWSDVFTCPDCAGEVVLWDCMVDKKAKEVREEFPCPHCHAALTKRRMERAWISHHDDRISQVVRQAKQIPVLINYSIGGRNLEKSPDEFDLEVLRKAEKLSLADWFPTVRMMDGDETRRNDPFGLTHTHHFYTRRNQAVIAAVASKRKSPQILFWLNAANRYLSKMSKLGTTYYLHGGGGAVNAGLLGTLYVPSFSVENNVIDSLETRLSKLVNVFNALRNKASNFLLTTQSATSFESHSQVDYIFLDPPFGANLNYSELSFLWEVWLRVLTNNRAEAIESKTQDKTLDDYRGLMTHCFKEAFRLLKPGRWMTVEFSNTQASVWNSIQTALQEAGFIVANVSALDKQQGSFKAVTTTTAVKQDLVISAYKPNGGLEDRFAKRGETDEGVWDFIRSHLNHLPVVKPRAGQLELIAERDPRILYDRMVAFYVGHSRPVPLSSAEFQAGLAEKFPERDGMYFLPEQVNEYDKKRAQIENIGQLMIFVEDERSAINWLRNFLKDRPSTYQDIQPDFMQQLGASWKKWEARPELNALLDQNFLSYDGVGEVPGQIHGYLSTQFKELRNLPKDHAQLKAKAKSRWYVPDPKKNVDVETLRNKRLLEEFWSYLPEGYSPPALTANKGQVLPGLTVPRPKIPKGKKLKELRTEAVRVGFKHCYQQKDYTTILVVAEMLPESVLNEDEQLQMIFDTAVTRTGGTD